MQFKGHSALLLKCPRGSSMWNHHDGLMKLDHKDRGQKFRILWAKHTIFVNSSSQAILIFSRVSGLLSFNAPNRPLSYHAAFTTSQMAKNTEHPRNIPDSPRLLKGNKSTRLWLSVHTYVYTCMYSYRCICAHIKDKIWYIYIYNFYL